MTRRPGEDPAPSARSDVPQPRLGVRPPWTEVAAFVRAALFDPVPRDHWEPDAAMRRRRIVVLVTLILGAVVLALTLRIPPGDVLFYAAGVALAAVWTVGALASGPLHLGRGHTRRGERLARPVVQSLALGVLLLALFMAGALVVAQIPLLRGPVDALLDHARYGSVPIVLGVTVINGIAEELYFRGALYTALPNKHAVLISTLVYMLTTVGSGVPLLVLAAGILGFITALQRRVTGGILGPALTHITWSSGMLLLLPLILG